MRATSSLLRDPCPQRSSELNSPIPIHWFLRCQCSLLPSPAWPCPTYPDSQTSYSRFLCNTDFIFTPRYIHDWVSFLLWPSHFFLSGAISNCLLLFPRSVLDTFWSGGLIFQCHIFLPFHTVHGVLSAGILEWIAIYSSNGPSYQNTSWWPIGFGWPWMALLITSLSDTTRRLWSMKGLLYIIVYIC